MYLRAVYLKKKIKVLNGLGVQTFDQNSSTCRFKRIKIAPTISESDFSGHILTHFPVYMYPKIFTKSSSFTRRSCVDKLSFTTFNKRPKFYVQRGQLF